MRGKANNQSRKQIFDHKGASSLGKLISTTSHFTVEMVSFVAGKKQTLFSETKNQSCFFSRRNELVSFSRSCCRALKQLPKQLIC